jgi:hypothetical protein
MRLNPVLLAALAVTGCGVAPGHAPTHPLTAAARPPTLISVSFSSASRGWLLAQQQAGARPFLLTSADGGRHWHVTPAAPFRAGGVTAVTFGNIDDGWLFGSKALWATRDGGARWRRVPLPPGGELQSFTPAFTPGADRVLASVGHCRSDGLACSFRIWTATAGSDAWRPVPGAAGGRRAPAPQVVVSGRTGFALVTQLDPPVARLLSGPADGSRPWRQLRDPCRNSWSAALAAQRDGQRLLLACGSEPGAGQQLKTAYVSRNGGRTWRRVASPPSGGYVGGASTAGTGPVYLSGGRMDIYISADVGRSWHDSASMAGAAGLAGAGFNMDATAITATRAVAIQYGVNSRQLWLTSDGGRRWTPVTVR